MKRIFLFFTALLGLLNGASAQMNIDLAGYPLVTTGWTYSSTTAGTAAPVDSTFRLTNNGTTGTASYLYYNTAINMNNWCSWTADFDFKITPSSGTIADGFAFWFLTSPPSSATGAGIGLPANPNGLVLIFDTYDNYSATGPHIPQLSLLGYNGTTASYVETSATGRLCTPLYSQSWVTNGNWHHVTVTYVLGNINVYFDYSATPSMTSTTAYPLTITGYFGFSGSTGAITSTQLIKNVHIVLPVNATPTVTSPVHYCLGDAASPLTATGGSPLRWFTTDTATVTALPTAPTPNTSVAGTTTYYVRSGAAGSCISAPDSVKVVVTAPVTPTVSGTTSYCTGDTYVPFTVSGTTGTVKYYTTASGGTPSFTAPVINTAVAGITNIYVSQTDSGCESARAPFTITVSATPAPPVVTPPTYCQFDAATPLAVAGSSLTWYGPGVTAPFTTTPTPSTATPHIDTFYVTQTVGSCTSDSARDIVTVKLKPNPPLVADTSYCQLFPAPALTAVGTNLLWYTTPGGVGSTTAPVPSTATPGIATWYVTQTVNGCTSNQSAINVTTMFLPNFTITQSRPYVCQGDTLLLSYSGAAPIGGFFTWTLPEAASFAYGSTSSDVSVMVRFDSVNQQDVILRIGDHADLCANYDTLRISVSRMPYVEPYIQENVCLGDTVALGLTDRSSNAATYTWDFAGASVITHNSNSGGPYTIKWSTPGIHVIKVTGITAAGCKSAEIADTVKVHMYPKATFSIVGNGPVCMDDSVHFRADSINMSYSYYWTPTHFFKISQNPDAYGRIQTNGYVSLRVSDPFGCYTTDSLLITPQPCCTVLFPSAFTPNGDGKNDVFRPVYQGYHNFHNFRITNRWGQTVFESTNNQMSWDGKYNGDPQDMGVYYYFVKYDCGGETLTEKGDVTLIR
jgi:gliding motility-associated-like protein